VPALQPDAPIVPVENRNGGVFDELTSVVLGLSFPKSSAFRFKDVLRISPELSGMYKRHFESSPRWTNFYSQEISQNPFRLEVCVVDKDEEEVLSAIPEFAVDFERQPG
jgi:hypothetical protein